MSVAEQLAEFMSFAVEKIMIIANETSTSAEGSAALQNSTMSGEEAVQKHQASRKVFVLFWTTVSIQNVTLKAPCISQASLATNSVETTTIQIVNLRPEQDTSNTVILCIYIVQGLLMLNFNSILFLGIAVRVLRDKSPSLFILDLHSHQTGRLLPNRVSCGQFLFPKNASKTVWRVLRRQFHLCSFQIFSAWPDTL